MSAEDLFLVKFGAEPNRERAGREVGFESEGRVLKPKSPGFWENSLFFLQEPLREPAATAAGVLLPGSPDRQEQVCDLDWKCLVASLSWIRLLDTRTHTHFSVLACVSTCV